MRLDDSEAALAHLQSLVSLAERLRCHSIAVLSHQYDYLAFGSCML